MITKGIVEELVSDYEARVRLPILDGIKEGRQSTATQNLGIATICSLPNSHNNVSVGDIVFVGFEDMDMGKPIILGHLFKESEDTTYIDASFRQLKTSSTTILNKDTTIGEVLPENIEALKNIRFNIQNQIDQINTSLGIDEKSSASTFQGINSDIALINTAIKELKEVQDKLTKVDYIIEQKIYKHLNNITILSVAEKIDDKPENRMAFSLNISETDEQLLATSCVIYYEGETYNIVGIDRDNNTFTLYLGYNTKLYAKLNKEDAENIVVQASPINNSYVDIYTKYNSGKMEQHMFIFGSKGNITSHKFLVPFADGSLPMVTRTVLANSDGGAQRLDGHNVKNVTATGFDIYSTDINNSTINFISAYGLWRY